MNYNKYIQSQKDLYTKGINRVWDKRKSWEDVENRANNVFQKIIDETNQQEFFEFLYVFKYDEFSKGKKTNQHFISLQMGSHPNGIQIIKDSGFELSIERGGALVIAQGPQGEIYVTIYPCESKEFKIRSGHILLGVYSKPSKLTDKKIQKAVEHFFWYSYISSFIGRISLWDILTIQWLKFKSNFDILKIGKLFSSVIRKAISLGAEINGLPKPSL